MELHTTNWKSTCGALGAGSLSLQTSYVHRLLQCNASFLHMHTYFIALLCRHTTTDLYRAPYVFSYTLFMSYLKMQLPCTFYSFLNPRVNPRIKGGAPVRANLKILTTRVNRNGFSLYRVSLSIVFSAKVVLYTVFFIVASAVYHGSTTAFCGVSVEPPFCDELGCVSQKKSKKKIARTGTPPLILGLLV